MKIKKGIAIVFLFFIPLGFFGGYFFHPFRIFLSSYDFWLAKENQTNIHHSALFKKDFFDDAFRNAVPSDPAKNLAANGVVVPHHLVAANFIAGALESVSSEKSITVVLLSPNHFFAGRGQIISSLYDWDTPYGRLPSDTKLIRQLQARGLVSVDETPFEKEHGIFNVTPFIKKAFPNAKIIPLIMKDNLSLREGDAFSKNLNELLPKDALVIASLDFSHYLPSAAADFHDAKSMAVLEGFDYEGIEFLDIDSKPSLRIFLKYLEARGANKFYLLGHSNSAKVLKEPNFFETTSYIMGFFVPGEKTENRNVTLLSFGDIMLDRYVGQAIDEHTKNYPWERVARMLGGNDITLANLEGSFTDFPPKPLNPANTVFTFDPHLIPTLKRVGFDVLNVANNHSLDFGEEGLRQSRQYLEENGINFFGDPLNKNLLSVEKNIRGVKIGFVGYNEFSIASADAVIEEIQRIKKDADFVVVYAHWGREYSQFVSPDQKEKAHQFIDAGADVVFGSHPHVIQPLEMYKNKMIFYSLGNFLFDQTFSQATQQGLGAGVVFGKDQTTYYLFPTETRNFQVNLLEKDKSEILLQELADRSIVLDDIKKQIIFGEIHIKNFTN